MGFLRALIIILVIYYVFDFFKKYIFPIILKKSFDYLNNKVYDQKRKTSQSSNTHWKSNYSGKIGETVIYKKNISSDKENLKTKEDTGEYVDYEEVKD